MKGGRDETPGEGRVFDRCEDLVEREQVSEAVL